MLVHWLENPDTFAVLNFNTNTLIVTVEDQLSQRWYPWTEGQLLLVVFVNSKVPHGGKKEAIYIKVPNIGGSCDLVHNRN